MNIEARNLSQIIIDSLNVELLRLEEKLGKIQAKSFESVFAEYHLALDEVIRLQQAGDTSSDYFHAKVKAGAELEKKMRKAAKAPDPFRAIMAIEFEISSIRGEIGSLQYRNKKNLIKGSVS